MRNQFRISTLVLACLALLWCVSCGGTSEKDAGEAKTAGKVPTLTDKPLPQFQTDLLELAFNTATAIPVNPHVVDRSKAQDKVVTACLKLDQPRRALGYIEQISDWQKGSSYADLALYCVRNGNAAGAKPFMDQAVEISKSAEDWRKDTINVKLACAYALLGKTKEAEALQTGVTESQQGKVAGVRAETGEEGTFEEQMKEVETMIAPGNFDILRNAIEVCAQLYNRFYDNEPFRSRAEEKIKTSWGKLPVFVQIELLMELTGFSLDHGDQEKALGLVNETQSMMEGSQWPLEVQLPLAAKLAALRFRAGDVEKAVSEADATWKLYNDQGKTIVSIWRGGAIRPLAEAYQTMGKTAAALSVYQQAVKEGVENPNSRPRAEDLSATCSSMALCGVEPDAGLWAQIRNIRAELREPW